uniref:Protein phosphatase 2 regulatory subunit B''beta n=1 Tax=Theropithecus gelada TaxID=9565 RepID=A0A8D2F060_THEGE
MGVGSGSWLSPQTSGVRLPVSPGPCRVWWGLCCGPWESGVGPGWALRRLGHAAARVPGALWGVAGAQCCRAATQRGVRGSVVGPPGRRWPLQCSARVVPDRDCSVSSPGPGQAASAASAPERPLVLSGWRRRSMLPGCNRALSVTLQVQTRKEEPLPPASSQSIPTFYFPRGRPQDSVNVDAVISKIESTFARFPHERATMDDMGLVAKVRACGCPLYWKGPLFCGAGGERTGSVSVHKFVAMWRKILHNCHDDAAKFVHLLMSPGCNYLVQEDFVPFLQDVVNTHPGLSFLKEASEFHSRYITTVIQRIFYTVNRSWSGRITCAELRRSSFLQNVALLEEEADINQLTEFFSYEHFYVIYCKFWELDTDHDLLIDAHDLARHNDHAISTKMIDRIFSGAVTRGRKAQKEGKISYADFVWFLISEEDKKTPTSIEYWFRCMDLDGDGALSMFELEYFYEEQCRRLDSMAIEALPFQDCLCQMLDLVKPRSEGDGWARGQDRRERGRPRVRGPWETATPTLSCLTGQEPATGDVDTPEGGLENPGPGLTGDVGTS